ncbi:hypothetical protein FQA39_LY14389 [Lamprigera yunnana]|nr:hypothetical protein FQA39_LY14389 [Lamprigera yunnana]
MSKDNKCNSKKYLQASSATSSTLSTTSSTNRDVHYLKEDALFFRNEKLKKVQSLDNVPQHTPNSEYEFDNQFKPVPPFPDVANLEIPYIRDKGIKHCIMHFGNFFDCNEYAKNYLQFWFLDIVTDCVWCMQDEYRLPVELQKIVLQWFLYFLDILRDPKMNVSRKEFFNIFKEAILIAAEVIDEGNSTLPTPKEVFALATNEVTSEIDLSDTDSSISSLEINEMDYDNHSYVDIPQKETEFLVRYELPKETCNCDNYDISTIHTLSESRSNVCEEELSTVHNYEGSIDDDMCFYKPDLNIPDRFLPLFEEDDLVDEETEDNDVLCKSDNLEHDADDFQIYEVDDKFEIATETESFSENTISSGQNENKKIETPLAEKYSQISHVTDQEVLKALTMQKVWEQRIKDMDSSCKGWISSDVELEEKVSEEVSSEESEVDLNSIDDILKKKAQEMETFDDKVILNFGALWAIIELVFKYFYESFQFSLIKLAFQATPDIITQHLNSHWNVPKRSKKPFERPASKIVVPKPVVKKPPLKPQTPKEKEKKVSKPEREEKMSKKSAVEKKLEQKVQEQLLKQQKIDEEKRLLELKIEEENRLFLFPLLEGATDDLFQSIFPNWTKEKQKKTKK